MKSGEISKFKACSNQKHQAKPDKKIFEYILNEYSLDTGESVFIDDNEDNIKTAQSMGIHSLKFDGDYKSAERFIYG